MPPISTNLFSTKLNNTKKISSSAQKASTPYMSATDKALKSGVSAWTVASNNNNNNLSSVGTAEINAGNALEQASSAQSKGFDLFGQISNLTNDAKNRTVQVTNLETSIANKFQQGIAKLMSNNKNITNLNNKNVKTSNEVKSLNTELKKVQSKANDDEETTTQQVQSQPETQPNHQSAQAASNQNKPKGLLSTGTHSLLSSSNTTTQANNTQTTAHTNTQTTTHTNAKTTTISKGSSASNGKAKTIAAKATSLSNNIKSNSSKIKVASKSSQLIKTNFGAVATKAKSTTTAATTANNNGKLAAEVVGYVGTGITAVGGVVSSIGSALMSLYGSGAPIVAAGAATTATGTGLGIGSAAALGNINGTMGAVEKAGSSIANATEKFGKIKIEKPTVTPGSNG